MNYYETGHAKNVANFEQLINYCIGYGTAFNPSKAAIKIPALQTLLANAKQSLTNVNSAHPAYDNAVAARELAFEPLSRLVTRIQSAVVATDTSELVDDHIKTLVRKLQGRRASAKLSEEEKKTIVESGKVVNEVSTSQMSYDNRVDKFEQLLKLVTSLPQYLPNENDLKLIALNALLVDLKLKNQAVVLATIPLSNARISRNDLLYKPLIGIVDLSLDIKTYIKSIFGTNSAQYRQISSFRYTRIAS